VLLLLVLLLMNTGWMQLLLLLLELVHPTTNSIAHSLTTRTRRHINRMLLVPILFILFLN
jgi:hypothetical protein